MTQTGSEATQTRAGEPAPVTLVLPSRTGQLRLWLHRPPETVARRTAVVMCGPFGSQDLGAWRFRRWWAAELARAGHPTVRFDLPGTGDSEGRPDGRSLVGAWLEAIIDVEGWAREAIGAPATAAVGMQLGGLLAAAAIAAGAGFDELVLWGVPARGRRLVREMRAVATLAAPAIALDGTVLEPLQGNGDVWLTGFVMSAATAQELEAIDLTANWPADHRVQRALLLGRDALPADERLAGALSTAGVAVTLGDGDGYAQSQIAPEFARPAAEAARATVEWLSAGAAAAPGREIPLPRLEDAMTLSLGATTVSEIPCTTPWATGGLFGLLAEPERVRDGDVCVVMIGAGAQRHIGPNRNWVDSARRWAAEGIRSVRVDLSSIGESDGHPTGPLDLDRFYDATRIDETLAVLQELRRRELGQRFVLVGLCAGAYWSLHAALRDPSVVAVGAVNLVAWEWTTALDRERGRRMLVRNIRTRVREGVAAGVRLREFLPRGVRALREELVRTLTGGVERGQTARITEDLDRLRDQGTEVILLLAETEPFRQQLAAQGIVDRLAQWPNVSLEIFAAEDHAAKALSSQQVIAEQLDSLVRRVSSRPAPGQAPELTPRASPGTTRGR